MTWCGLTCSRCSSAKGGRPRAQVGPIAPLIVFHGERDGDRVVHPIHGGRIVAWVCAERSTGEPAAVEPGRIPGGRAYTRTIHRARDGRAAAAMLRFFEQFHVRRERASSFRARGGRASR